MSLVAAIPAQAGGGGEIAINKTTFEPRWTRSFAWTLTKTASPQSIELFFSDTAEAEYTITASAVGTERFSFHAFVTIENTGGETVTIVGADDRFTDDNGVVHTRPFDCNESDEGTGLPVVLEPGESLSSCEVTVAVSSAIGGSNVAVIECQSCPSFENESNAVRIDFPSEPTLQWSSAELTDTNGDFGAPRALVATAVGTTVYAPIKYRSSFACVSNQPTAYENTATLRATTGSATRSWLADATVTVHCDILDVRKTADSSYVKRHVWEIEKYASHEQIVLARKKEPNAKVNELALSRYARAADVRYAVRVASRPVDERFKVAGEITISNPFTERSAHVLEVTDQLREPDHPAVVSNCRIGGADGDPGGSAPPGGYVVGSGQTLRCDYVGTPPERALRNTASALRQVYHFPVEGDAVANGLNRTSITVPVEWGGPARVLDTKARVYDSRLGILGWVRAPGPSWFAYTLRLEPGAHGVPLCGLGAATNRASVVGNDTETTASAVADVPAHVLCFEHVGAETKKDEQPDPAKALPKLDPADAGTSTDEKGRIDGVKNEEFPQQEIVCTAAGSFEGRRGAKRDPAWKLIGPRGWRTPFYAERAKPTYGKVLRRPSKGRHGRLAKVFVLAKLHALSGSPVGAPAVRAFVWSEHYLAAAGSSTPKLLSQVGLRKQKKLMAKHTRSLKRFVKVSKRARPGGCAQATG